VEGGRVEKEARGWGGRGGTGGKGQEEGGKGGWPGKRGGVGGGQRKGTGSIRRERGKMMDGLSGKRKWHRGKPRDRGGREGYEDEEEGERDRGLEMGGAGVEGKRGGGRGGGRGYGRGMWGGGGE